MGFSVFQVERPYKHNKFCQELFTQKEKNMSESDNRQGQIFYFGKVY